MGHKDHEQRSAYNRQYYLKHQGRLQETGRIRSAKYQKSNKPKRNTKERAKRAAGPTKNPEYGRRSRLKLKMEVITHYGGKCACCGIIELEFLTIDHVNGGGAEHRKRVGHGGGQMYRWLKQNSYPEGFQVLCANCNLSKAIGGICAHRRKTDIPDGVDGAI